MHPSRNISRTPSQGTVRCVEGSGLESDANESGNSRGGVSPVARGRATMGRSRGLLLIRALLSAAFGAASLEFAASSAIAQTIVEYPVSGLSTWSLENGSAIAPGPDGALWFVRNDGIGRITTDGDVTEFYVPNGTVAGIAAGPDGNIWFTEPVENRIGFFSRSGKVKEFEIPYQCSGVGCSFGAVHPNGIVAGPDGNLWFTETGLGRIGRISTAGVMRHFHIRTPADRSRPTCIAAGRDGALWFTESFGIGRITIDGAITEFQIPANCITGGPDGALWYTASGRIGRIDVSGAVTAFFLPGNPNAITAGPDGSLWFTMSGTQAIQEYQIGRISTGGILMLFRTPKANSGTDFVDGITSGPDGAVWYLHYYPDSIGRITAYLDKELPAPEQGDRRPIIVPFR